MLACMSTLLGGFFSKLWRSGPAWLDGRSLAYYTQINTHGRFTGALPWMKQLLCDYPVVSAALAVKTILFQGLSPFVLFYAPMRVSYVVAAWGFHIGIWMTMNPQYLPQACCYFLGLQWWWEPSVAAYSFPRSSEVVLAARAATALALALIVMCATHFELWPFTCVPMYSPYRDLRVFSHGHLASERQAVDVALEHASSGQPTCIGWADAWVQLRLAMTTAHPEVLSQSSTAPDAAVGKAGKAGKGGDVAAAPTAAGGLGAACASTSPVVLPRSVDLPSYICNDADTPSLQRKHLRRTLQNAAAEDLVARRSGQVRDHWYACWRTRGGKTADDVAHCPAVTFEGLRRSNPLFAAQQQDGAALVAAKRPAKSPSTSTWSPEDIDDVDPASQGACHRYLLGR